MNFGKTILASSIGSLIAGIVGGGLFTLILVGIISGASAEGKIEVKEDSILKLNLSGVIAEHGTTPFNFDMPLPIGGTQAKTGLYDIRQALKKAKDDENIKGVYIRLGSLAAGWATTKAIRDAIVDFKESGKFIYAYSEIYNEQNFYLASTADKVFLYPEGGLELNGLASTPFFLAGALEKLGVEPKVFRVGTFKSAVEPFINTEMSDANRLQIQTLLNDMWENFLDETAQGRGLQSVALDELADGYSIRRPQDALQAGLVDGLKYEDEVLDMLMEETGKKKTKDLEFVSIKDYMKAAGPDKDRGSRKNKVAVVFAEGQIVDGKGQPGEIGSASLAPILRKVREDSTVKAVVLRVNSPGGSALASDVIWREVTLIKEAKPIIVSMGDLAASGGYYISANADKIYAEPTTITGSIGVFGLMYNTEDMFKEKLGITFDRVSTNPYADLGNPNREMKEFESELIQESVNQVYSTFINVVKEGRGFPDSLAVDSIAQGRVWAGSRAIDIGLVDELGGLDDAVKYAAEQAGIEDDYRVRTYPEEEDPFQEILKSFGAANAAELQMMQGFEKEMAMYKEIKRVLGTQGVLMMMPQTYVIE